MTLEDMTLEQLAVALKINKQERDRIYKEREDIEKEIIKRVNLIQERNVGR